MQHRPQNTPKPQKLIEKTQDTTALALELRTVLQTTKDNFFNR